MSYIGAIFLFHMGKYKAFKCMSNLIIGDKFLRNLFSFNMQTVKYPTILNILNYNYIA